MTATTIRQKTIASAKLDICDLCHHEIQPGEKYTDDGSEIAHVTCSQDWFRRNFGREDLS